MGFDLGLAAIAYQGAKSEQRRMREDEFRQAQHDYTRANMEEQTGRRGYRDNAAALADAEVAAQRTTLPLKQEAAVGALGATIKDQALAEQTRPQREAATLKDAETGVVKAQNANDDANNIAAWSEEKKAQNGAAIDLSIAGREDVRVAKEQDIWATIYDSDVNKKVSENQIIARLNAVGYSNLIPQIKGRTIADVDRVKRPDGDVFELRDAAGAVIHAIPVAHMKALYEAKAGKGEIVKLNDGQNAYRENPDGTLKPLTENKKSFNPNGGLVGRAGGAGAVIDRFAAAIMADAKAKGKQITQAEAMTQASAQLKANPGAWAARALQNDFAYTAERDPVKRREMEAEAVEAAKNLSGAAATKAAPSGLDAVSPESQAKINAALGL